MVRQGSGGVRLRLMLAIMIAGCVLFCAPPKAYAQGATADNPCTYAPGSPACREAAQQQYPRMLLVIGGLAAAVWIGWLITTSVSDSNRASRREQMHERARNYRAEQAEDLARVTAALAKVQQGGPNAADTSISVRGRVGSVDVSIHSTRSARAIAEAEALKRHAQSMSNHREL